VVAVRSLAGDEAVVYFPVPTGKAVHLDRITGPVTGAWMDPRDGRMAAAGTWAAGSTPTITPPAGWADAVLHLTPDHPERSP
jgi:Putative collagen-binding domain of a collagenase